MVEDNFKAIRKSKMPVIFKYVIIFVAMLTWKYTYYAHNIIVCKLFTNVGKIYTATETTYQNREIILQNIPYILFHGYLPHIIFLYIFLPSPFLLFGWSYFYRALIFVMIAETLSNIHSFSIVVPNHTGDDLYRYKTSVTAGGAEFYLRGLLSSVAFTTGGLLNDILHGYLNYQIEHHIFPNESLLFYERLQPLLKEYCSKNNLPYIQESVFVRMHKMTQIMVGNTSMKVYR